MDKQEFLEIITKTHEAIEGLNISNVCVCGSSRFCDLIAVVKWELEKKGIIATGLHLLPEWYTKNMEWTESHQEKVAHVLDELHLRKIDASDCVLVVNPNNYIGERTSFEIQYAKDTGTPVYYWEPKLEEI